MPQLQQLLNEKKSLLEKLARQEQLLDLLIHDIKNPLTAIQMTIDLLRLHQEELPADQRAEMLDRVDLLAGQMRELLYEVISSQREGSIFQGSRRRSHDEFKSLLKDVLAQILPVAEKKGIQIKVNNEVSKGVAVDIDYLPLKLILVNLLSNAIKYSTAGYDVVLRMQIIDKNLKVEIRDQGVGLTRPDIEVIFNKFAAVSSVPTAGEKQNRLGLYNVKTLVTALDGTIKVESPGPNQGTTFIVSLPLGSSAPVGGSPADATPDKEALSQQPDSSKI